MQQQATLKFFRQNSVLGMGRNIEVTLDGKVVGEIDEGQSLELSVEPGMHTASFALRRRVWGSLFSLNVSGSSKQLTIDIMAGQTKTVTVKPKTKYIGYHALVLIGGVAILTMVNLSKIATYALAFIMIGVPLILMDRSMLDAYIED